MCHGLCLATFLLVSLPAAAGTPEAQSCSAGLDANSRLVFDATIAKVTPGVDLRAVVTDSTRQMVMAGKLSRGDAKPAATAAGQCLKLAAQ